MRIVYVGDLVSWGTCRMRMMALGDLGCEVIPLDTRPTARMFGRWLGAPFRRLLWGPPLWRLNRQIMRGAKEHRPDVVWIDKGRWVFPETLESLRKTCDPLLIHYTPDPAIVFHRSRHFVSSIPLYDLIITAKSYELDAYNRLRARRLVFQQPGFDKNVHQPQELSQHETKMYGSDVAFIGHWEPEREVLLGAIHRLGVNTAIWGPGWPSRAKDSELVEQCWRGKGLYGCEYAKGWSATKIGLNPLSKLTLGRAQTTSRSIEIPACRTFMLSERTDEHLEMFEEGKEAEFFESDDELLDKTRYYLKHEDARRRIAAAGRERCLSSGYSYHDRLRDILAKVEALREQRR